MAGAPLRERLKPLAVLLVTFVLIELALQGLVHLPTDAPLVRSLRDVTSYDLGEPELQWKRRFLELYDGLEEKTVPISQREYDVHPRLGWMPRRNLRFTNHKGDTYTTNGAGFRSLEEYARDRARFTLLILGDSFTYGSDSDDSEVWPTILQGLDSGLQVLNMGIGGYGTDQMYLMLEDQIAQYEPDLVIAAVIDDDLGRSMLSFRDYQKPRFEIRDGELVLTNTPIRGTEEVARQVRDEIRGRRYLSGIRLVGVTRNVLSTLLGERQRPDVFDLNERIFEAMLGLCGEHGARFMLLYLPWGRELTDAEYRGPEEEFVERFGRKNGVDSLNPRGLFLAGTYTFSRGHYKRPEATLVAEAVYRKLRSDFLEDEP